MCRRLCDKAKRKGCNSAQSIAPPTLTSRMLRTLWGIRSAYPAGAFEDTEGSELTSRFLANCANHQSDLAKAAHTATVTKCITCYVSILPSRFPWQSK